MVSVSHTLLANACFFAVVLIDLRVCAFVGTDRQVFCRNEDGLDYPLTSSSLPPPTFAPTIVVGLLCMLYQGGHSSGASDQPYDGRCRTGRNGSQGASSTSRFVHSDEKNIRFALMQAGLETSSVDWSIVSTQRWAVSRAWFVWMTSVVLGNAPVPRDLHVD